MSTTFAIKTNKMFIKVAFRSNSHIEILNDLIFALSKNRRVYAIDNGQQGVYTIKDILNNQ